MIRCKNDGSKTSIPNCLVLWNMFYFPQPDWGWWSNLTKTYFSDWNHQLAISVACRHWRWMLHQMISFGCHFRPWWNQIVSGSIDFWYFNYFALWIHISPFVKEWYQTDSVTLVIIEFFAGIDPKPHGSSTNSGQQVDQFHPFDVVSLMNFRRDWLQGRRSYREPGRVGCGANSSIWYPELCWSGTMRKYHSGLASDHSRSSLRSLRF